ncbi:Phosphoadenosine phosphosulfate reductase [Metallosphaera sp. J1]|uniref:phosphoadenylyl-sulfate reductase n=1 Tax=Metallosphaera javensis (ex Hofmann et al. 2022) TaxID=99938 RepID=UPI001EE11A71|nr:phosphoadenylyl-sulfate reductase [Metallosphaera javensis (ex Hofmann et al. 2022)]MCG3110032.1 Phosphoadenosine phosphosulfate reductase [Metallosphaera javensis (ex Hofmann et al. 2022)]
MPRFKEEEIVRLSQSMEGMDAEQIVGWAMENFQGRLAIASSFQVEDMVVLDIASRYGKVRVFTIDTGRLPQEIYDLIDAVRERYGIQVEVFFPKPESVEKMVREHGVNLFYKSVKLRQLCCWNRKVEPLKRALEGLDAWITGLRREQWETRSSVRKIEVDKVHGNIIKINPLADWTWEQVWRYVKERGVPYCALYERGYMSIGCLPCTRPVKPGEHPRAGRWWWEQGNKECGIHVGGE